MPKLAESNNPVFLKAKEIFGSHEKAALWLEKSNPDLNGNTPLTLLNSQSGSEQVMDVLTRIEHGVYFYNYTSLDHFTETHPISGTKHPVMSD